MTEVPMATMRGRVIRKGKAEGPALVSEEPVSFYGGVDLQTGVVVEEGHPLAGKALGGHVLVIPRGKGSTVGSWALLRLARRGLGPRAVLCARCETIVAVGAILAEIPCVDNLDLGLIPAGSYLRVDGDRVEILAAPPTFPASLEGEP